MNKRGSNVGGSGEIDGVSSMAEIANMMTRAGNGDLLGETEWSQR